MLYERQKAVHAPKVNFDLKRWSKIKSIYIQLELADNLITEYVVDWQIRSKRLNSSAEEDQLQI